MFGLTPPEGTKHYFGLRAIFSERKVDIVHDRITRMDITPKMKSWLQGKNGALDRICKKAELNFYPDSTETIEERCNGMVIMASCKGSYGYLYIGCWEEEE